MIQIIDSLRQTDTQQHTLCKQQRMAHVVRRLRPSTKWTIVNKSRRHGLGRAANWKVGREFGCSVHDTTDDGVYGTVLTQRHLMTLIVIVNVASIVKQITRAMAACLPTSIPSCAFIPATPHIAAQVQQTLMISNF